MLGSGGSSLQRGAAAAVLLCWLNTVVSVSEEVPSSSLTSATSTTLCGSRLWHLPPPTKMNGGVSIMVCLSVTLLLLLNSAFARRSQDLHCGACRALVDELEWEISQVDPKKTIQIGSFRINPDGSQSIVEEASNILLQVPYARSEAHLTELLERICEKMKDYGEKVDPSTHRKNYLRVISHDGTKMDLSETKFDGDVTSSLKFACESIAEEYEDELIEFFSREVENVKDRLCSKRTDLCDHALHLSHDEL